MKLLNFFLKRNFTFYRFLIVGSLASIINLLCFYVLFYQLNIFETLSYSISYITGISIGYIFNKKWSFNYKNESNKALFSKYLLVYTFNLFIGMGVFELVLILSNIEELIIQAIVIIITAISNFLALKIYVFR
jgi:putative flippase GtrA